MARRVALLLAALCSAAPVAAEEPTMPRVIYGESMPQVIYGPPSAPPAAPPPAPRPEPAAQGSGTMVERGWVPAGPSVWVSPPVPHRPMPPRRPAPLRIPDQPMPQGWMRGAAPDARWPPERR